MNRRIFLTAAAALLTGLSVSAQSSSWTIDKSHSQADFQIRHLAVSNVRGAISGVTGTIVWDEKNPSKSSVEATLDATTVNTSVEARDKHLKSADFFNVEKFPTITFKSTSVTVVGNGKLKVVGDLTLAGVTKPVTLDVEGPSAPITQRGKSVTGFSATGVISRADFNFGTASMASKALGDDVKFTLDLEASK